MKLCMCSSARVESYFGGGGLQQLETIRHLDAQRHALSGESWRHDGDITSRLVSEAK